jgi:hypothetical protein
VHSGVRADAGAARVSAKVKAEDAESNVLLVVLRACRHFVAHDINNHTDK